MTLEMLWRRVPSAVDDLTDELIRRGSECFENDERSQQSACFLLALGGVSILYGMFELLKGDTLDSWDVLARSFMESRDLMTTFRFDDEKTRDDVRRWFKNRDQSWKPNHKRCEKFLNQVGARDLELAKRWGLFSGLAHPTISATRNSVAILGSRTLKGRKTDPDVIVEKKADYISDVVTLLIVSSYEISGWISLAFDISRATVVEKLRTDAPGVVVPILNQMVKAR